MFSSIFKIWQMTLCCSDLFSLQFDIIWWFFWCSWNFLLIVELLSTNSMQGLGCYIYLQNQCKRATTEAWRGIPNSRNQIIISRLEVIRCQALKSVKNALKKSIASLITFLPPLLPYVVTKTMTPSTCTTWISIKHASWMRCCNNCIESISCTNPTTRPLHHFPLEVSNGPVRLGPD